MRSALLPTTPATVDLSLILRGLFATAVVWWHTVGAYHTDTIPHWLNVPGRVSVWIFFGLSGYVIGHGFFSGRYRTDLAGLRVYLSRRAARILPLFWLVTALAVALTLVRGGPLDVSAGNLMAAVFALQWSNTRYFVGVFWTLGLELQFYLVAPALMALLMARHRATLPLLCALWVALMLGFGADIDNRSVAGNLQHFLAGIAVAALVVRHPGIFARNTAPARPRHRGGGAGPAGPAVPALRHRQLLGRQRRAGDRPADRAAAALPCLHRASRPARRPPRPGRDGARRAGLRALRLARALAALRAGSRRAVPRALDPVDDLGLGLLHRAGTPSDPPRPPTGTADGDVTPVISDRLVRH